LINQRGHAGLLPIGKQVCYFRDWLTITGVCGAIKHGALDESSAGTIYVPYPQVAPELMQFVAGNLNFVIRSPSPAVAATGVFAFTTMTGSRYATTVRCGRRNVYLLTFGARYFASS
jgi:hypothetical protein